MAVLLEGRDAVAVGVLFEVADHVDDDVRPLLQVPVHDGEAVARRLVQPREDGGLFPVVAGKMDGLHRLVRSGDEVVQDVRGPVFAAVVDEDELVVGDRAFEGADDRVVQRPDIALFIVTGDDE